MRGAPAGEHAGCVTWYRAAGRAAVNEGGAEPGGPNGTDRVPDELALVLAQAAIGAIEAVGGYAGGVYLPSRTPGLLRLAVMAGLPNAAVQALVADACEPAVPGGRRAPFGPGHPPRRR